MFDTTQPFRIEIQSGGVRTCRLNFPSDQKLSERTRKQKSLFVDKGNGKTRRDEVEIEDFDIELFEKIRIAGDDAKDEFDKYEASMAIDRLTKAEIVSCEKEGDKFVITLLVFGDVETVHRLREPRRGDIVAYDRSVVSRETDNRKKVTYVWAELGPGGTLYDKLQVSASGYAPASSVPIIHKAIVVSELNRVNSPEA